MGNRAVITTARGAASPNEFGVYLHWNGGRDSVEAFLTYCKLKEYCSPEQDDYGWARLCQVVGNYFGGSTSLGFDLCNRLDMNNRDNGVYLMENWEIVGRKFHNGWEQQEYDIYDMLNEINAAQPEKNSLNSL